MNKAVVQSGAMLSYRSFTTTRAADFGFSATQAQVFVHVDGGSRTVDARPQPAGVQKNFDGTTWADGATGTDFYLGNIAGTATTS